MYRYSLEEILYKPSNMKRIDGIYLIIEYLQQAAESKEFTTFSRYLNNLKVEVPTYYNALLLGAKRNTIPIRQFFEPYKDMIIKSRPKSNRGVSNGLTRELLALNIQILKGEVAEKQILRRIYTAEEYLSKFDYEVFEHVLLQDFELDEYITRYDAQFIRNGKQLYAQLFDCLLSIKAQEAHSLLFSAEHKEPHNPFINNSTPNIGFVDTPELVVEVGKYHYKISPYSNEAIDLEIKQEYENEIKTQLAERNLKKVVLDIKVDNDYNFYLSTSDFKKMTNTEFIELFVQQPALWPSKYTTDGGFIFEANDDGKITHIEVINCDFEKISKIKVHEQIFKNNNTPIEITYNYKGKKERGFTVIGCEFLSQKFPEVCIYKPFELCNVVTAV